MTKKGHMKGDSEVSGVDRFGEGRMVTEGLLQSVIESTRGAIDTIEVATP